MAVGDDKVFLSTYDSITAYDLKNGVVFWKIDGPGRSAAQAPIYIEDENLLLLDQSEYRLVKARTGEILYKRNITFDLKEPPVPNQGIVTKDKYLRITPKGFEILDIKTGEVIHRFNGAYNPLSLYPSTDNGRAVLNAYHSVELIDLSQLTRVWQHSFSSVEDENGLKVYGGPLEYNGAIYVVLSDATIRALDRKTGEEIGRWQGSRVERLWGIGTPFIPGFAFGSNLLFASFGTTELCAFSN